MKRSNAEKIVLAIFLPAVVLIYAIKSYPEWITGLLGIADPFGDFFFLWGKKPNFWYQTVYTAIVVTICIKLLIGGKSPYGKPAGRKPLPRYQKSKFLSILLVQSIGFYFVPFVLPMFGLGWSDGATKNEIRIESQGNMVSLAKPVTYSPTQTKYALLVYLDDVLVNADSFQVIDSEDSDSNSHQAIGIEFVQPLVPGTLVTVTAFHLAHKMAHVYLSPSFFSAGAMLYMFFFIPIFVWFFGKRYCSWICACGNLAETVGTTTWGSKWVKEGTPRGKISLQLEWIQNLMLILSLAIGFSAVLNAYHVIRPATHDRIWYVQDFLTDFMFGSIIGVGLYPFYGTRMWCRYGCPMARWMKWFGRFGKSTFAVVPNDKCRGVGLCTQACPMGIPVADYAHKDRKPIEIAFGLETTSCIGCGGCVAACPVDALSFQKIGAKTIIALEQPKTVSD